MKTLISLLSALGTIAVAVLAIWGNWVRSVLAPLSLTLTLVDPNGDPELYTSGARAMFYHLKVVNQHSWLPAENCRVLLISLSKRDPGGIFKSVPMPFPIQFVWTPAEFMGPVTTVLHEQILDFGFVGENDNKFTPRVNPMPNAFAGYVGAKEVVRFQLQIEATNFLSPIYVVEVASDGKWSFEPDVMKLHLSVKMIDR